MDSYRDPNIRLTTLWNNIFKMTQDERYAGPLIDALFAIKNSVKLTREEFFTVHSAYDNKLLFSATGNRIKGEDTDGMKSFVDIIFKYWHTLVIYLPKEVREVADSGYREDEM